MEKSANNKVLCKFFFFLWLETEVLSTELGLGFSTHVDTIAWVSGMGMWYLLLPFLSLIQIVSSFSSWPFKEEPVSNPAFWLLIFSRALLK